MPNRAECNPLYDNDRQTILDGKWLWGIHLSAMQLLLRAQLPHLKGLEDTVFRLVATMHR